MKRVAKVIVNGPFREGLDYLTPKECEVSIGQRVLIPLRNRKTVGFICDIKDSSELSEHQLKSIISIIDSDPILDTEQLKLTNWLSRYYHCNTYDALQSILPSLILKGEPLKQSEIYYKANANIDAKLQFSANATKQKACYNFLLTNPDGLSITDIKKNHFDSSILNKLKSKNLISELIRQKQSTPPINNTPTVIPSFILNDAQQKAIKKIKSNLNQYHSYLLDGVTGSGKTEVYLQVIDSLIKQNKQVLVLVPEIGLTKQLVERFESRFDIPIITYHSYLNDKVRLNIWQWCKNNQAKIIIGTRSSVFLPFKNLGAIIVDEEHDSSYKQQNQLRYNGRDIAILRAKLINIPIILGSATPSLESLYNVEQQKYTKLTLSKRAGNAQYVTPYLIDMRQNAVHCGLSQQLIDQMQNHLTNGDQVLLFLNRRGYAPTLICQSCGHIAQCSRCDAPFTYHVNPQRLICHFCETTKPIITHCDNCQSNDLSLLGQGTERIEEYLVEKFPKYQVIRIDKSSTTTQNALNQNFELIKNNQAQIIIGTQMMAKGHHFPNVTLVGIINIDAGLYSYDFRALERTGQLITQVAGRAGRDDKKGYMYLQTHTPDHPLLNILLNEGYPSFAQKLKEERKSALWPPYSQIALIRGDSKNQTLLENQMTHLKTQAQTLFDENQSLIGPFPAIRHKKQDRYRMMILLQASSRAHLQHALLQIENLFVKSNHYKIRFSIDIDPIDMM